MNEDKVREKLRSLDKKYDKIEKQIIDLSGELRRGEQECNCDDRHSFWYIWYGNWMEIAGICLNCGGYLTDEGI